MLRLIFARHGNTFEKGETPLQIGARTDLPLTQRGREQAEALGYFLKQYPVAAIYTGQLKRQRETASIVQNFLKIPHLETSALDEIDYGAWEGLSIEAIQTRWPSEYAAWEKESAWASKVFGSSQKAHLDALAKWMDTLEKKYKEGAVAAITSNGLLRFLKPEKVKTGHFCELLLRKNSVEIVRWNCDPQGCFQTPSKVSHSE